MNELQIYPAKLLLLLEKYDNAAQADKSAARDAIKNYVVDFATSKKQLRKRLFEDTNTRKSCRLYS